ncbi:coiled-coil domain-containing protein 180-like, partial [Cynoglossus semilaevis]|uniref:coiled-coil domain-containing protein 180-like n=1 Tax=Cynoglossus semilaevis TaxID=244447 RepID=UPI000D628F2D
MVFSPHVTNAKQKKNTDYSMYRQNQRNRKCSSVISVSESRTIPSGKIYRQLFDAQVQLSRSLLAGRRDVRTECLTPDSNTQCSTASRLCSSSSSRKQMKVDESDDVHQLPSTVAVNAPRSDINERLAEKKQKKHNRCLKQLDSGLREAAKECEAKVRIVSEELLSFLQQVDLRLDILKVKVDQLKDLDDVDLQTFRGLWEQLEKEVKLKQMKVTETNNQLRDCETQQIKKLRTLLQKYCTALEKISFLLLPDIHRLVHSEAMMLNQSLLANRRSVARLVLLLQEEILQQESFLHLHWEECFSSWRKNRITQMVEHFRSLCSSDVDQQLIQVQTLQHLSERRCDVVSRISSLAPPNCSAALVSEWFNQLTAINQQIDSLQNDFLLQLRCCCQQRWEQRLTEAESCKVALSDLQLSDVEVEDVVNSQLLPLIGQVQRQDEERLAALDTSCDSTARHAHRLSFCVFAVIRGAASIWEMHNQRMEGREKDMQQQLNDLWCSQMERTRGKKLVLDELLAGLRQESNEDALETSLDKTVLCLQNIRDSYSQCASQQFELLDQLPSLFLDELLSYSSTLSSFYQLKDKFVPDLELLQKFHLSCIESSSLVTSEITNTEKPQVETDNHPTSLHGNTIPTESYQDWLSKAEISLQELYDISSNITFESSSGRTYTGPVFRCPEPDLQLGTHLSLFPVELLTHTMNRTRSLFLDNLEQHVHDVLSSAVVTVKDRKEAVMLDHELQLQLLDTQHIQTHVYQPRLAELQLHRQQVERHCSEVLDLLTSCRTGLQALQASVNQQNSEFTTRLSKMENDILTANRGQRLEIESFSFQECLDEHIKHTQSCQSTFREMVQRSLEKVRTKTADLLSSFRLFSEGGDFAPQELKTFQRRLKEQSKQINTTEQAIRSELEVFESKSLQQVKKVSDKVEETLSVWKSEVKFTEKVEEIISSTRIQIRAEAASCNQQQSVISSRLEDVRRMMEDKQVSPDQICCLVSSAGEDMRRYSQDLDFEQKVSSPSSQAKTWRHERSTSTPGPLQPSGPAVAIVDDAAADVIKFLNDLTLVQEKSAETEQRVRTVSTGRSSVQQQQKSSASVSSRRSITTDRRFQIFGPEPEHEPQSFMSTVNFVLWKTNSILLQVAEDFYQRERHAKFHLLPDTLDLWAESTQQRLLGYQEQAVKLVNVSRRGLENQEAIFKDLLRDFPSVLISNYGQKHEEELTQTVCEIRQNLEVHLANSEQEKKANVQQLRASLRGDRLLTVVSREEERQKQLHSTICSSHLKLQDCLQNQ